VPWQPPVTTVTSTHISYPSRHMYSPPRIRTYTHHTYICATHVCVCVYVRLLPVCMWCAYCCMYVLTYFPLLILFPLQSYSHLRIHIANAAEGCAPTHSPNQRVRPFDNDGNELCSFGVEFLLTSTGRYQTHRPCSWRISDAQEMLSKTSSLQCEEAFAMHRSNGT
jgi:hypothetical protein